MDTRVATILPAFLGGLATLGAGSLLLLATQAGTFHQGRTAVLLCGVFFVVAALPMFALPFSRRVAKWLLALVLVLFASLMLVAVFHPSTWLAGWKPYQAAAVALAVLIVVRLVLAWRQRAASPSDGQAPPR